MRRRLSFVLAVGALGTGCLLTTSLDGLSGPPDAAGDGGADADASAADVNTASDAPTEAAPNVDFRCALLSPAPAFCTDFDEGTVASIIGPPSTAFGGEVSLDDTMYRSPSRSLKLTAPPLPAGMGPGRARVSRTFGFAPLTSIVIELDLRLDSTDGSAENAVAIAMGGYELALFLGSAAAKIREGVPGDAAVVYTSTNQVPPKSNAWLHLSFTVKLADKASSFTVAYDGVSQPPVPLVMERYRAADWDVVLGLNFVSGPDEGREMHIDNLVIDAK